MARGQVRAGMTNVATGQYLDIQPTSPEEWTIHNIYHEGSIEIHWYDGTNSCLAAQEIGAGIYAYQAFHCTNQYRIRVKNTEASSKLIGYDGILTYV